MTPFAGRVYDALSPFVLSPWNVLKAICSPQAINPLSLEPAELGVMVDAIGDQVSLVTDADNGAQAKDALRALVVPERGLPSGKQPRPFHLNG